LCCGICCRLSHDKLSGEVTLFIDQSLVSDRGTYAVHVGQSTSQLTVDVISELPAFTEALADQTVSAGQPLRFTGVVHGVPRPLVRWFINDVQVVDTQDKYVASYGQDGRVELQITSASSSDVGLACVCMASSAAGAASSLAVLKPGWCQAVRKPVAVVPVAWSAQPSRTVRVIG